MPVTLIWLIRSGRITKTQPGHLNPGATGSMIWSRKTGVFGGNRPLQDLFDSIFGG
jgi:hypothetical protein